MEKKTYIPRQSSLFQNSDNQRTDARQPSSNSSQSSPEEKPPPVQNAPMKRGTRIVGPPRTSSIPQGADKVLFQANMKTPAVPAMSDLRFQSRRAESPMQDNRPDRFQSSIQARPQSPILSKQERSQSPTPQRTFPAVATIKDQRSDVVIKESRTETMSPFMTKQDEVYLPSPPKQGDLFSSFMGSQEKLFIPNTEPPKQDVNNEKGLSFMGSQEKLFMPSAGKESLGRQKERSYSPNPGPPKQELPPQPHGSPSMASQSRLKSPLLGNQSPPSMGRPNSRNQRPSSPNRSFSPSRERTYSPTRQNLESIGPIPNANQRKNSEASELFSAVMDSASSFGYKLGPTRLQPVEGVLSPEQSMADSARSQTSFPDPARPRKKSTISSVLQGLESKSKPELLAIAKKMVQEISVKNRIIHESKQNEKWILAEMSSRPKVPLSPGKKAGLTPVQLDMLKLNASDMDRDLVNTMIHFKEELSKAKASLEQHETSVMLLEKKRTVAEEEAAYLKTLIENGGKVNPSVLQNQRVNELEAQLQEVLRDYTTLQTKVSQWARNSKRHQEGRITAEASQRVLEEDLKIAQAKLSDLQKSEALLQDQLQIFQSIGSGNFDNDNLQRNLLDAYTNVKTLEQKLSETTATLQLFQKDFETLQVECDQELQKRIELQNANESLLFQNQDLQEKLNSQKEFSTLQRKRTSFIPPERVASLDRTRETVVLNHELEAVKDSYEALQKDHRALKQTHQETVRQLELSKQKFFAVEEAMREQELLVTNIEVITQEKESLQQQLDEANNRMRQKQLSIEMLEKHVAISKNRLVPLQKAAEEYDDLKDEFEDLKEENLLLQEHIQDLTDKMQEYERKISESAENANAIDTSNESDEANLRSLQQALQEAQSTNEMLSLQLEERTQDVELLESRLEQQLNVSNDMFSVAATSRSASNPSNIQNQYAEALQELEETKKELEMNASTLAQQLITIGKMEATIASDADKIENLEAERARLAQKLALMHRIKADYDSQTVQLEKMQARIIELESQLRSKTPDQLNRMETENSMRSIQDQFDAQSTVVASLNQKIEVLQQQVDTEKKLKLDLDAMNQTLQLQIEALKAADDKGDNHYHNRVLQLETAMNNLLQQKENISKELANLRFIKEDYDEEVLKRENMEAQVADMAKKWSVLENTISQKENEIDRLESELDDMQSKFQLEINMLKEEQDNLLMERDDLLDRLEDKETEIETLKKEIGSQVNLSQVSENDGSGEQDVSVLVAKLGAAEVELEELKLQLSQQQQSAAVAADPVSPEDKSMVNEHFLMAQHYQEVQGKNEEIEKLHDEVHELQQQIDELIQERNEITNELQRALEDKKLMENDLQYQAEELDQVSAMLEELQQRNSNNDQDVSSKTQHEKEVNDLKEQISELVASIERMQTEIDGLQSERQVGMEQSRQVNDLEMTYRQEIAEKQEKIEELERNFSQVRIELEASLQGQPSTEYLTELESKLNETQNYSYQLESHIEELEAQISASRSELEKCVSHIDSLKVELSNKTETVSSLESRLAQISSSQQGLAERDSLIQDLQSELKEAQSHVLANEDLENEIQSRDQKLAELQFEMSTKLEHQANTVADLEAQLELKQEQYEELQKQISNQKPDDSRRSYENQIQSLKEQLDQQTLKQLRISQELEEAKEHLKALEVKLASKSGSSDTDVLAQLQEISARSKELEEQLVGKTGELDQLHKLVSQLQHELGNLRVRVSDLQADNEELQGQLEYQSGIAEDAMRQIDEYEDQILQMQQGTHGQEGDSNTRIEELELMNEQLLDKIAALSERIANQDANRVSMSPQLEAQYAQERLQSQVSELMMRLQALNTEKMQLLDQMEDLKDHNQMLQTSLQSLDK